MIGLCVDSRNSIERSFSKAAPKPAAFKSLETLPDLLNVTGVSFAFLSFSKITDTRALFSPLLMELTVPQTGDLTKKPGLVLSSKRGSPLATESPSLTRNLGFNEK